MSLRRSTLVVDAVLLLAVAMLVVTSSTFAGAAADETRGGQDSETGRDDAHPLGLVDRVLVFSVPTLTWKDVRDTETPHLDRLINDSAVGDLSVRSVTRHITSADGYMTLNAGTRSDGAPEASLAFEIGGQVSDVDTAPSSAADPWEPGVAMYAPTPPYAPAFELLTGAVPENGDIANFGVVALKQANASLHFGAEVGALGDALKDADIGRFVIANGDHEIGGDRFVYRREATTALIDSDGLVDGGRVDGGLLLVDPLAPFGVRLDQEEVIDTVTPLWASRRGVVLVEGSDLLRSADASPEVSWESVDTTRGKGAGGATLGATTLRWTAADQTAAAQTAPQEAARWEAARTEAVEHTDELLGALLELVDPETDAVVLVAPSAPGDGTHLTTVAVRAPGVDAGLLSSGTTRRDGFVQTVDIAPTVLSLLEVDVPSSMEGTPMRRTDGPDSASRRVDMLIDAGDAALFRDGIVGGVTTLFVLVQPMLWVLAAWAGRRSPSVRNRAETVTLAALVFLSMTFLAGLLPFFRWGQLAWWLSLLAASGVGAFTIWRLTRRRLVGPLLGVLGLLIAVLSVDIVTGGRLQFNTVFGYTPTVAGRFNGMGNLAFAMLAAGGIILACLLVHRWPTGAGRRAAVALLVWYVVLDAAPMLGADVGGGLTLIPAGAVTAAYLTGWTVRPRTVILGGLVGLGVLVLFGLLDLTRPAAQQTHLGRLLSDIGANGFGAFETVVVRKLQANMSAFRSSVWTLTLPMVFAAVMFLRRRAPSWVPSVRDAIPELRSAWAGLLVALPLGFVLNDSGIAVPGMMLAIINLSFLALILRLDGDAEDLARREDLA
ncbi:MAG: hypothetical protein KDB86_04575 [Actinobacteria bacterium]|nr:hypothetical protein [Actinomycetota bacterium]